MDRTLLEALDGGLVGAYEPCPAFSASAPDDPVCAGCGWLDHEHECTGEDDAAPVAQLHTLKTHPRTRRSGRLAS